MSTVAASHVWLDERGVAWIDDRNIKVVEVALDRVAHGLSPEEIYDQHDGYLTLAQIYAALAYYYDHQTDFDRQISDQVVEYNRLRSATLNSPGRLRLRALGKHS